MTMSQFRNNFDWVKPRVLGEGGGDDFEGVGKGLSANCFRAGEGAGIARQCLGDFDFRGSAACDEGSDALTGRTKRETGTFS